VPFRARGIQKPLGAGLARPTAAEAFFLSIGYGTPEGMP